MTNKNRIKTSFQKSIKYYDSNALIQKEMANELMILLGEIGTNHFSRILEIGCGTGLLTQKISHSLLFQEYFANDLSGEFQPLIKQIIPQAQFYWGDAEIILFPGQLDLIISNAVFQWFENWEKQIIRYKSLLKPNGFLVFTTFGCENFKEIKFITGNSLNYLTFDRYCEVGKQNYQLITAKKTLKTLYFKTPMDVLKHIRKTGVNGNQKEPWNQFDYQLFSEKYKNFFHQDKGYPLTYEPYYFIFKKECACR